MVRIFHLMLVLLHIYINSTNIPPIMIISRIYENLKPSVAVAFFLPGRAKDLSAPLYYRPTVRCPLCVYFLIEFEDNQKTV